MTSRADPHPRSPGGPPAALIRSLGIRHVVDALVCLALAVILFRTFEVEGYLISTGSMAPHLLGYHKRVVCPKCGYLFSFGVSYDSGFDDPADSQSGRASRATCPNCGERSIDISRVPRNQGDQLLVHKHAYSVKPPRRWEVVVFRNPHRPTQAYVKRIVGLPGERVQILDGDIFIDGTLQRKTLAAQRALRLPVYDHDFEPHNDPEWEPRWIVGTAENGAPPHIVDDAPWKRSGNGFRFEPSAQRHRAPEEIDEFTSAFSVSPDFQTEERSPDPPDGAPVRWLTYRHWIRSGGSHQTSVPLATPLPEPVAEKLARMGGSWMFEADHAGRPVRYEAGGPRLVCIGVLDDEWKERLLDLWEHADYRNAIRQLAEKSHLAPVTDFYGYNRSDATRRERPVRDLMLEARLTIERAEGEFLLEMTDGQTVVRSQFDLKARRVRLFAAERAEAVREADLPADFAEGSALVEMSLFDRQVVLALDGAVLFLPWELPELDPETEAPRTPVRIGARGLQMHVQGLKLYRDVYYTRGKGLNSIDTPLQLKEDEYFVLGDNSPVSSDSRSWPTGGVPHRLLLGKPLIVHLPSRPGKIQIGNRIAYIRIPDVPRIRYIR